MSLFSELKRRNVLRVAIAYLAAAWLLTEVAETLFPMFGFGAAPARITVIVLAIGFPLFIIFSWVFELTPEGLMLEKDVQREVSITARTGKQLDRMIIVLLALALGYFAFDKFVLEPARVAAIVQETAQQARSEALIESYGDLSIAVLPFLNLSADPNQEYFSDGISEELLNLLAQIPEFRIISRSSSFSFKGQDMAIPEVARQLNVAHVLEGSVRKAGNRVRISAQLIEGRSDTHLWSETYERDLTTRNLFAIQFEIAEDISAALDSVLTTSDREQLSKVPTENLDAYYAYHLGRQRMINRTVESLEEAVDLFRRAIEIDPDYALAYVGLADAFMLLGDYGALGLEEMVASAEPALNRALELDVRLAPAYASLGAIRTKQFNFAAAEAAHLRAIELDPNYATAYHWYGDLLVSYAGRPSEAIPLLERALALDPLSPAVNVTMGQAFEGVGHFERAVEFYDRAIDMAPDYPGSYFLLARIKHNAFGRLDEAFRWRTEGLSRNPRQVIALANMGMMFLDLGDDETAERWIDQAISLSPGHFAANRALVLLFRYRGNESQALENARRLFELVPGNKVTIATLVHFGRYEEALQKYLTSIPELACPGEPSVTASTVLQALDLSLAFERTGNKKCADLLLDLVLQQTKIMPRLGLQGTGIADVAVYARQGKIQQALTNLGLAIDDRWRAFWWAQGKHSPHMDNVRDHPEFTAMMAEIEVDMATQLERIRTMGKERGGTVL
jgi:TolB-like protein/Tfp pilus assembly protein PilF